MSLQAPNAQRRSTLSNAMSITPLPPLLEPRGVRTRVTSQWKSPGSPGQFSAEISSRSARKQTLSQHGQEASKGAISREPPCFLVSRAPFVRGCEASARRRVSGGILRERFWITLPDVIAASARQPSPQLQQPRSRWSKTPCRWSAPAATATRSAWNAATTTSRMVTIGGGRAQVLRRQRSSSTSRHDTTGGGYGTARRRRIRRLRGSSGR